MEPVGKFAVKVVGCSEPDVSVSDADCAAAEFVAGVVAVRQMKSISARDAARQSSRAVFEDSAMELTAG